MSRSWTTPSHRWSSGPWELELRDDEFADIRHEGVVVLRSVRAVVRDRDWNTAGLMIDRVGETDDTLTLHVRTETLGATFRGVVRVEARAGRLDILCDLESARAFSTNRTGLVVLHPPALAGEDLVVTHADATIEQTRFPSAISPHQPVIDIRALAWRCPAGEVSVAFEGDVFEMEDQRNWTDASFKTYSRPLALPFPYTVGAGERVRQRISVRVDESARHVTAEHAPSSIVLRPGGRMPLLGLGAASAPDPQPEPEPEPVGDEVLVELDLATPPWRAALERAHAAGLPLDVRFVLDPDRPEALADGVAALVGSRVARVAAFHRVDDARHVSDGAAVAALRQAVAAAGLDVPVVGGSRSHFTELNRERHRIPDDLDGLTVTVTPLFHALGTEQLVESIAIQRLVALQSVEYAAGRPLHIGPVTLRPRFNDVATAPQPAPSRTDLSEGYGAEFTGSADPRQTAEELAAWTIASAAALAVPGVASLVYFEEWGPRGIRAADGAPFPVADAVHALAELDGELLWGDSPDGLAWALGARTDTVTTLLCANLSPESRDIVVDAPDGTITAHVAAASFTRHRLPPTEDPA